MFALCVSLKIYCNAIVSTNNYGAVVCCGSRSGPVALHARQTSENRCYESTVMQRGGTCTCV